MVFFNALIFWGPLSVTEVTEVKRGHLNLKGKYMGDGKENETSYIRTNKTTAHERRKRKEPHTKIPFTYCNIQI